MICLASTVLVQAQNNPDEEDRVNQFSPLNTAVPSLSIAPDARGGGMGDNGASTLPDIASQYWNPAKYAFMESKAGVGLSYTPWMRKVVNDVALAYLSGYYKLGPNDNHAIGASIRYFSLGAVPLTDIGGVEYLNINPYEMSVDLGYNIKLNENLSMGVTGRYIRSDMGADADYELQPGNAAAADVSFYGERYFMMGESECLWSAGMNISNIGTKITYDGGTTNQFLPTNLRIGTGVLMPLDEYNQLGIYIDANKYLVPSKPIRFDGEEEEAYDLRYDEYNTMNPITGMLKSFSDAPGGSSEEMKEINLSFAAEYNYNSQFFVRGGYFYENQMKGNRQYFTFGAGLRMNVFNLDAAYLISTVPSNPLDQTLRFTLSFDMDGLKGLFE
ncbi:MAG: type IX secretion system outer membrane channel protein PorV [Tannerella sp.]|nr:type IX secretion system outer membrane channel protein PorV [Tannerella sp.]